LEIHDIKALLFITQRICSALKALLSRPLAATGSQT